MNMQKKVYFNLEEKNNSKKENFRVDSKDSLTKKLISHKSLLFEIK